MNRRMPAHHPPELGVEHRVAVHKLFEAIFAFAWKTLDRYGLSRADRDDIAQNVALAALCRWSTYREDSGTPAQWLRGIVRNEYRFFVRTQDRHPLLAGDDLYEVPSEASTPEESASLHDLADHLLAVLPIEQRRVVVLYVVAGLTYREIAALEGISKTEAHDRHQSGMLALAAAVERHKGRKLRGVALPVVLGDLVGGLAGPGAEPPPALREQAWRRAAVELGLDPVKESVPPDGLPRGEPSFARDGAGHPSSRPPGAGWTVWVRRLAPIGLALISGLSAGPALERCTQREAPVAAALARAASTAAAAVEASPAESTTPPSATDSSESPTGRQGSLGALAPVRERDRKVIFVPAPATSSSATPAPEAAPVIEDGNAQARDEQRILDRVRNAIVHGNLDRALGAIAEHEHRFPYGQQAGQRERFRSQVCAQLRADPTATRDERCSGK
jgi:RNA polymerase sigma factor (sigma-70 family)